VFRTFSLPLTAVYTSIWSLMVSAGFCDSRGYDLNNPGQIIPDRVRMLDVRPGDANAGNVTYRDQFASPGTNQQLTNMSKHDGLNSVCLKDYLFADSTGGDLLIVEIESI